MPVTAKFSEAFYKAFGHKQVDELVDWCNQVDATYRSEFRELFDVNFARLDAKLEQRIAELRAELRQETAELRGDFGKLRISIRFLLKTLRQIDDRCHHDRCAYLLCVYFWIIHRATHETVP